MELIKRRAAAGEPLVIPRPSTVTTANDSSQVLSLVGSSTTASTSSVASKVPDKHNIEKLKKLGQKGVNWLETSRQIAAGEREVKLSFVPPATDSNGPVSPKCHLPIAHTRVPKLSADVKSLLQLSLGRSGPGIVLTQHKKSDFTADEGPSCEQSYPRLLFENSSLVF